MCECRIQAEHELIIMHQRVHVRVVCACAASAYVCVCMCVHMRVCMHVSMCNVQMVAINVGYGMITAYYQVLEYLEMHT